MICDPLRDAVELVSGAAATAAVATFLVQRAWRHAGPVVSVFARERNYCMNPDPMPEPQPIGPPPNPGPPNDPPPGGGGQ